MCRTSAYIYRSFFQLIVQWWRKQVFKTFLTNKKLSIIGQDFENFYRDIFMNNSDKSYSEIWSPVCLCLNIIVFLINLKHHDFSIENWFETKKKNLKILFFQKRFWNIKINRLGVFGIAVTVVVVVWKKLFL
jgi:hypothetical protein